MRIFDPSVELARAEAQRPRGLRPELPVPFPGLTSPFAGNPSIAHLGAPGLLGQMPFIGDHQVLGLPAAWRAVNLISNGVASMAPLDQYKGDGVTKVPPAPVLARPFSVWTSYDFWHQAVAVAQMRGNFVGLNADYDQFGYPRQVIPLPPQYVTCLWGPDGFLEYWFLGERYSWLDITHVRGFALPGSPWGIGAVENFRREFGRAHEQQSMAGDVYSRGAVPSGALTVDRPVIEKEQAADVQEQWIEAHGHGQRRPAVLPKGWTFQPISWSPEDAQFLQSRQFSVAEIALMFNLDPTDLGASLSTGGAAMTYANIEDREIARITDAYGPWMHRFEEAWSDLIPADNTARFNPDRILRTDSKTRATVHQINIASGVETVEEAREADGREPIPETETQEQQEQEVGDELYELPPELAPPAVVPPGPVVLPSPPGAPDITVKPATVKV